MKVVLAQTESEWAAAKARREAYERRLPAGQGEQILLAPLRETIAVEESRLREIELLRAALVLRSPVVGQVSQVWSSAGQSVRPGDPIVTIVESSVRDIIVYVADSDARRIPQRTPVLVTRRVVPRAASESVVVSVGESVQQLPPRLWRDPRVPDYGRAVVVAPVRELNLTSGELVDVKMLPSR
jgi:multidrug resistance efflux pump